MMTKRLVSYLRVSTVRQGRSGLGLDAQRSAVMAYVGGIHDLVAEYVEVESGKSNERPQLAKALHRAKVSGATLVIARLDRLSRNAAFLLAMRDSGVNFIAVDMPDANEMTVGIMAIIAEGERKTISSRTREALAAARTRGRVLGNRCTLIPGNGQGAATRRASELAESHARDITAVINDIQSEGITSLGGIARELESRQIQTPRGGFVWRTTQVSRVIQLNDRCVRNRGEQDDNNEKRNA
jgi:DNA invertase Pin-like site-specific DNA recombinase